MFSQFMVHGQQTIKLMIYQFVTAISKPDQTNKVT